MQFLANIQFPKHNSYSAKLFNATLRSLLILIDVILEVIAGSAPSIIHWNLLKLKVAPKNILKKYNEIKRINPKKNLVIGFGITDKTITALKSAQGLVCGSLLCKTITNSLRMRQNPVTKLDKVVYNLKKKIL